MRDRAALLEVHKVYDHRAVALREGREEHLVRAGSRYSVQLVHFAAFVFFTELYHMGVLVLGLA